MDVWILWHIPPNGDKLGDYFLIGVYSSDSAARAAVERLASKPGFRDNPEIVDDTHDAGFFLSRCTLDEDDWTEGYRTD